MIKRFRTLSMCFFVTLCFMSLALSTGQAQVTITVEDGSGFIGSTGNTIDVTLNNPSENVKAVNLDICDVGDYLSCSACETTERSSGFSCTASEQEDGCVEVVLLVFGDDVIEEGNGPIFTLICDVSPSAPPEECREVSAENIQIANDNLIPLDVTPAPGDFCFDACVSDGDCDGGTCNQETGSCNPATTTTTTPGPSTTTTTVPAAGCAVTIDCAETALCPDDDCTTCTAATVCDGEPADGTYTWELNSAITTADTGNAIEICPEDLNDGSNTLMVTDTANDDATDTETIAYNGSCAPTECAIDVLREDFPKSHWLVLYPVLMRIETIGMENLNLLTPVTIECEADGNGLFPSILKTGKVVVPNLGTNTTMIWQTALIWPAILTQNMDADREECTLTVNNGTCSASDTFELDILSIGGIPLGK